MKESETKYYHVAASHDAIVSLDATYIAEDNPPVVIEGNGHLSVMSSPELINYLLHCLFRITIGRDLDEMEVTEAEVLQFIDEACFLKNEQSLTLVDACIDIEENIKELQARTHLFSSASKVQVLATLLNMLREMLEGDRGENFIHVNTIGDFIDAYLQGKSVFSEEKPIEILNKPLNYPLSLFQSTYESSSKESIERLVMKYKTIPLPVQQNQMTSEKMMKLS